MQAPIGPATTAELVRAVARTGALGTLAALWTEAGALRRQLQLIDADVGSGYCVNLVLAFDQRERLEVVLAAGVRYVSFSWGIDRELIWRARAAGAVVMVQVGDVVAAVEAAAAGADVVIAQGVEAGGHVQGTTPLMQLLGELRPVLKLPLVAAGGIADSASARAALAGGADAVACGTAYLAAHEADVHPGYYDRLLKSTGADTVLTTTFDVGWPDAPHRIIRNETYVAWESAGRPPAGARPRESDIIATRDGTPIARYNVAQPTTNTAGDIKAMALYAGTGVDLVRESASAEQITLSIARDLR